VGNRSLAARKIPPYGNIRVLDLDGRLIFRCGLDKAEWYLSRDLGKKVADNTIQLTFKANGPGHLGDEFFLQDKHNRCVVCGSEEKLTRHHIVPYCYRRFFPRLFKCHSSYDVMVLCIPCHGLYEESADKLKVVYAKKHDIPVGGRYSEEEKRAGRTREVALTLLTYGYRMPKERIDLLVGRLREFYGCPEVTIKMVIAARDMEVRSSFVYHGSVVVANEPDLYEFCKEWRYHFLDAMQPKFMPDFWSPDRHIDRTIAGDKERERYERNTS
jgi:hypothetical protein